jgi:hypothetical protein
VEVCLGGSELQGCPPEFARLLKLILWSDFRWGITYLLTSRVSPLFLDRSLDSASESGPRVRLLPLPIRAVMSLRVIVSLRAGSRPRSRGC